SVTVDLRAGQEVPVVLRHEPEPSGGFGDAEIAMVPLQLNADLQGSDDDELDRAVALAGEADAAVVVVGTTEEVESEGFDRDALALPGRQDELVGRVAAVNPRTIVVVNAGAPVLLPWRGEVGAGLLAWFPGQEFGNALADVLLGAAEPGGRLPVTWPADEHRLIPATRPVDGTLAYDEPTHIGHCASDPPGWRPPGRRRAPPHRPLPLRARRGRAGVLVRPRPRLHRLGVPGRGGHARRGGWRDRPRPGPQPRPAGRPRGGAGLRLPARRRRRAAVPLAGRVRRHRRRSRRGGHLGRGRPGPRLRPLGQRVAPLGDRAGGRRAGRRPAPPRPAPRLDAHARVRLRLSPALGPVAGVDLPDLVDLGGRGAALELRGQPVVEDLLGRLGGDHPRAHGQHLGVVGLAGPFGRVGVVGGGRPDPWDLVGGDGHAQAGAADQQGAVVLA